MQLVSSSCPLVGLCPCVLNATVPSPLSFQAPSVVFDFSFHSFTCCPLLLVLGSLSSLLSVYLWYPTALADLGPHPLYHYIAAWYCSCPIQCVFWGSFRMLCHSCGFQSFTVTFYL